MVCAKRYRTSSCITELTSCATCSGLLSVSDYAVSEGGRGDVFQVSLTLCTLQHEFHLRQYLDQLIFCLRLLCQLLLSVENGFGNAAVPFAWEVETGTSAKGDLLQALQGPFLVCYGTGMPS